MDFSKLWTMDRKDLMNSLGTLVFSAVIGALYTLVSAPDFNVANIDWGVVGNMILVAVLTSIFKSSATTSEGRLMGVKIK